MSWQLADSLSIRSHQHVICLLVSSLLLLLVLLLLVVVVDWWTFCTQFVLQLHLGQDITERVLPELQTLHPAEVELGRNLQNAMGKFSGRFQMLSVIFSGLKSEETIFIASFITTTLEKATLILHSVSPACF